MYDVINNVILEYVEDPKVELCVETYLEIQATIKEVYNINIDINSIQNRILELANS